jgi:hypothetical protein
MRYGKATVFVASLTPFFACRSPTDAPLTLVHPEIEALRFEIWGYPDPTRGVLEVSATPADYAFRLTPGEAVPVRIETGAGETEWLALRPTWCGNVEYHCYRLGLSLDPELDLDRLVADLTTVQARLLFRSVSRRIGSAMVLAGDVREAAERARSFHGVQAAYLSDPFFQAVDVAPFLASISRPMAVDTGAPIPGDGLLQLKSGDVLAVSYEQPDGTVLRSERTLPVQDTSWGAKRVGAPLAWYYFSNWGQYSNITILDSGVDEDHLTGGDGDGPENVCPGDCLYVSDYFTSCYDDQPHGAHVAGIIASRNNAYGMVEIAYAPGRVASVKVCGPTAGGFGTCWLGLLAFGLRSSGRRSGGNP